MADKPLILCVEDDPTSLRLMERWLTGPDWRLRTATSGEEALRSIEAERPDLLLLDVVMPGMDGYQVCSRLAATTDSASLPVIFVTSLDDEENRARAFALGAVDYLGKPVRKETLLPLVRIHLKTRSRWAELHRFSRRDGNAPGHHEFEQFLRFLEGEEKTIAATIAALRRGWPDRLFDLPDEPPGLHESLAQAMAHFLGLGYLPEVPAEGIGLGILPPAFCRLHRVVAVRSEPDGDTLVLCNPFDLELRDLLDQSVGEGRKLPIRVTSPARLDALFENLPVRERPVSAAAATTGKREEAGWKQDIEERELRENPILFISDNIISNAVEERASDIHLEPKEDGSEIRFRVDGEMRHYHFLKKAASPMLVSRIKVLAGLDIAEKRRPQDGSFQLDIRDRKFKFRVATTATPHGESLIIRILDPHAKPKSLRELGMTHVQAKRLVGLGNRNQGMILVVGPTGSGKTTTLYSLVAQLDCRVRSFVSIEDPVEYSIPDANQQELNPKRGITFESLLKSVVRQDPDILFLGEMRDPVSARMAMDFASTGHLTLSTLHTTNATTAILRLERLGLSREAIGESVIAIVAQRLLRKLCEACKQTDSPTEEDRQMLRVSGEPVPDRVSRPGGCSDCRNTGIRGREGVFEIIEFDPRVAEEVRSGTAIAKIRDFCRRRGDFLVGRHALEKVAALSVSPREAHDRILVEEAVAPTSTEPEAVPKPVAGEAQEPKQAESILVVEDDPFSRRLLEKMLDKEGYRVIAVTDGVEALLRLGGSRFDLIVSDIEMPNLDGWKLLEIMNQKGLQSPVLFMTGTSGVDAEMRGLQMGAADFIHKPIQPEVLLIRIEKILAANRDRERCDVGAG